LAFGKDFVRPVVTHQARVVEQPQIANDVQRDGREIPRGSPNANGLSAEAPRPPFERAIRQFTFFVRVVRSNAFVNPPMESYFMLKGELIMSSTAAG
jgi:hypothetical protein